jgi:hypothetical protein
MLVETVEVELDKKRELRFSMEALMLAEREINRRRGARISEFVNIEYLIIAAASAQVSGSGGFPLDLMTVLLWAGLRWQEPQLSVETIPQLIDQSPLTHGEIMTRVWDAYLAQNKRKSKEAQDEEEKDKEHDGDPLARRPGSTTGVLQ